MAKAKKKTDKEASNVFHNIMKASVNKKPADAISEIVEEIKELNEDFPLGFVKQGLEKQIEFKFKDSAIGRELNCTINKNLPPTIADAMKEVVQKVTAKYSPNIVLVT